MGKQRRIETKAAKTLRNTRQQFALPGGSHDRLVKFLGAALPACIGVLAAVMVMIPLFPRGEVSFLLDRNKVTVINERLRVDNAMYRGQDNAGKPFSIRAGEAVQKSSSEGLVRMQNMVARILLASGPAKLEAGQGAYDIDDKQMRVNDAVMVDTADGFSLEARGVVIDFNTHRMSGNRGVSGTLPGGTFSARKMVADLDERTVKLEGDARLVMTPDRMRMPH